MKSYSAASGDLQRCIDSMQADHHEDLDGVTVSALFVFDLESTEAVLKHQGYPAQAVIRITPTRDRALGIADAVIVVDRSNWLTLSQPQRDALIDHELTHLERVVDEETGAPKTDAVDRPKLTMRRHDYQLGWFDSVAARHGDASAEIRQAKQLIACSGQLYFDFKGRQTPLELRRSAVTAEQDADLDRLIGRPPVFVSAGGEAADARLRAGRGEAEPQTFATNEAGVIDGRSERVKHQDEQREREGATA